MRRRFPDPGSLGRAGALIAACTVGLSASFVGLTALLTGAATGGASRLPVYVLVGAIAFVSGVVVLQESRHAEDRVLAGAAGIALASFLVVGLSVEGLVFAITHPDEIITSELPFYFLSAGLIATGIGYWGFYNWRAIAERSGAGI